MKKVIITTQDGTPLYTKGEVASLLEVSVPTIDRYRAEESLKPFATIFNTVFFTRDSVKQVALIKNKANVFLKNIEL